MPFLLLCIPSTLLISSRFQSNSCLKVDALSFSRPSGSSAKPADGKAAETATSSTPSKSRTEGRQVKAGEVNGFISPLEETPPAPQRAASDGAAPPPNTPPVERAVSTQAPPERPASLQKAQHPESPPVPSLATTQPLAQVEGAHPPSPATNGFSLDSADTSVLSPSSLSDSDLLEAVFDGASSLAPEKLTPEQPADITVNIQVKESPLPSTDVSVTQSSESNKNGEGETSNKTSHLTETVGKENGGEEQESIVLITCSQDEAVGRKISELKSHLTARDELIEGCDVPDGVGVQDRPSESEAVDLSLKPDLKKQPSFFKRNKKKSNQGNSSINFNKHHFWNASLLTCLKRKSIFVLFLLHFAFYILCMGYFSI